MSDDREAARAILSERAFAYVEALEAERDELRVELESERSRPHPSPIAQGLADELRDEVSASVDLRRAVEAALTNLNSAIGSSVPASNAAAAKRNLADGLKAWHAAHSGRGRDV